MDFKVGDKVRIINYGAMVWMRNDKGEIVWIDIYPQLIGQEGIVTKATETQGIERYALEGPNKTAWYGKKQLEKVLPAPED